MAGFNFAKRHKYGAKAVVIDGIRFASTREGERYTQLKILRDHGVISNLDLQPRYEFWVDGTKCFTYVADFRYTDVERGGAVVVEDVKGMKTDIYILKKKLIEAAYKIKILEV